MEDLEKGMGQSTTIEQSYWEHIISGWWFQPSEKY
jgi:hypothetical protein